MVINRWDGQSRPVIEDLAVDDLQVNNDLQVGNDLAITGDITASGDVNLGALDELTISGGAITVTKAYHVVDTEGDASSDDLSTINGGTHGDILVLRCADSTRNVTVKHGVGNIWLNGGADFTLTNTRDTIIFFRAGAYLEISRSDNT